MSPAEQEPQAAQLSTVAPVWEITGFLRKTTRWMLIAFSLRKQKIS